MVQKVVVTGGCGFIGSNIVARLITLGYKVKVIDDLTTGKVENIALYLDSTDHCEFVKGTITDYAFLEREFKGYELIIHEAANPDVRSSKNNLMHDFDINVRGTVNVLQAQVVNNISKIIFASSGGTVYGETEKIPTAEEHPLVPISHYGASKAAGEQYLSSFSSLYNLEAISLRLGNIFGPPSTHGVIYDFYQKLKNTPSSLNILGDGTQTKTYLYVDDCVDAHILALTHKLSGYAAFNITTSEGITVNEIAQNVVNSMGLKEVTFTYTGGTRGWEGDVRKAIPDITKAEKTLGWKPKTSIKEGIEKYIQWLQKQ